MATDLTWTQLSTQCPVNSILTSDGSTPLAAGLYVSLSNLTAETIDALGDSGVIEAIAKLLRYSQKAQDAANIGITSPNRLAAFSTANGIPVQDANSGEWLVTTTYTTSVRYPLNIDSPIGATN